MKELDSILFKIDPIEAQQIATGKNVNDLASKYVQEIEKDHQAHPNMVLRMPRNFFEDDQDMLITKHHRFSTMVNHAHNFIEMNYIYSGNCIQYINGQPVILKTHSLIMLDKNIPHSIGYMGKNDILVNILLKDGNSLNSILDNISSSASIVTKFLYNAAKIDGIHDNYIVFDLSQDEYARYLIECLIFKGVSDDIDKNNALHALYSLLVPELTKCIHSELINFNTDLDQNILALLNYIDQNYQKVTLSSLAEEFDYNPTYLGNKLKANTNETFQELVDDKKFRVATQMLKETSQSIADISYTVGYNSTPSLFRLFKRKVNLTPNQYRQQFRDKK